MNKGIVIRHELAHLTAENRGALLACGLWLRGAFIGASAAAIGLIQLFEGEWTALTALSTAAAGVAWTYLSWRRAQAALSDAKPASVLGATPAAAHR